MVVTDYNPINSFTVPGAGAIPMKGLIVVVGPNSSGKTQLLKDIHAFATGDNNRKAVVCGGVNLNVPTNIDSILLSLAAAGYIKEQGEGSNVVYHTAIPMFGHGKIQQRSIQKARATALANLAQPDRADAAITELLVFLGELLTTVLYIPNRLTSVNTTPNFDSDASVPTNDIQALRLNWSAMESLDEEICRRFGKRIFIEQGIKSLKLRVVESTARLTPRIVSDPKQMGQHPAVEDEGDGLRSYVAVAMAVLLGQQPICLIDEPELCLHPPQAYSIGAFIGTHAHTSQSATIVTTHSSHVLRGIVESATELTIIRLTRNNKAFLGTVLSADEIKHALRKPIARREVVLDGIFSDGVILVESEGDRDVYQCAWQVAQPDSTFDVVFVPVGGTGGFVEPLKFLTGLKIPTAIIADLDLLLNTDRLKQVLTPLSSADDAKPIGVAAAQIATDLKRIPPKMKEEEFEAEIKQIAGDSFSWSKNDDVALASRLRKLAEQIDRLREIKKGGIHGYDDDLKTRITGVIDSCKHVGLFFVPVGELEYWEQNLLGDIPKRNKQLWANEAVARIRESPEKATDLLSFVAALQTRLDDQLSAVSGA